MTSSTSDEVARRRAPWLGVVPLVVLLAVAWFIRSQALEEYGRFKAFCSATHGGETFEHVKERASEHGWAFVRQSREGAEPQEWLAELNTWTYRAGCVVVLKQNRVVTTRLGELPKK
ncbi:MAG: hypothetical protein U0228_05245 [Myxococcaceae bacterium]